MRTISGDNSHSSDDRRSFLKKGLATGAAGAGLALLGDRPSAIAQNMSGQGGSLTKGDVALLRFAAAAEAPGGRLLDPIQRTWRDPRQ